MAERRKSLLQTPNRRRRMRRRIMLRVFFLLVILLLIVTGIILFFRIPSLQVSDVEVSGLQTIDPAIIKSEADQLSEGYRWYIFPKRFILLYPRKEIEQRILAEHTDVAHVAVMLRSTHKAEIVISERTPQALYCNVSCYYLDASALSYQEATSTDGYTIFRETRQDHVASSSIGVIPLEAKAFQDALNFVTQLPPLGIHLNEISIGENGDLNVLTKEGVIMVTTTEPFGGQLDFLKIALSQPLFKNGEDGVHSFGYIDLRFGKKIFYRLDGSPATIFSSSTTATSTATSTLIQ